MEPRIGDRPYPNKSRTTGTNAQYMSHRRDRKGCNLAFISNWSFRCMSATGLARGDGAGDDAGDGLALSLPSPSSSGFSSLSRHSQPKSRKELQNTGLFVKLVRNTKPDDSISFYHLNLFVSANASARRRSDPRREALGTPRALHGNRHWAFKLVSGLSGDTG